MIILDAINNIGTVIIGIAMLIGLVILMNQKSDGKDKPALGCIGQIIVIILVLVIWYLLGRFL